MVITQGKKTWFDVIERLGNKIPHPLYLFIFLCLVVAIMSAIMSYFDPVMINPKTHGVVHVRNILSGEGLVYILENTIKNFTNFPPLGLVLSMMIAIGLVQEVGLAAATIKSILLNAPKRFVTLIIFFVGIIGNLASDAAFVLIPPLAGIIFAATKRNPVVGICTGFVAVAAGFTANIFIAGTDVLLSGVTNSVLVSVSDIQITPAANWYFMLVSVPFLMIVGTFITEKVVEPRFPVTDEIMKASETINGNDLYVMTKKESKALKITGFYALTFIIVLVVSVWPEGSYFRNSEGGLVPSPLLRGMIPIIMAFFLSCGFLYGILVKKIQKMEDLPLLLGGALKGVGGYIVLVFFIAQFIAWFNWSNLSLLLALGGADLFAGMQAPNIVLLGMLILLAAFLNLFIFSGSAQWALMAPVFIPFFTLLGVEPAAIQMAYRIGDSTTNIIGPTNPYLPMVLALITLYSPKFKFGTFLSIMLPFSLALLISWTILFLIYYSLGYPLGPA